jgi:hypothetical protein
MKTITGNEVRKPLAAFGHAVKSVAEAVKAIGFSIISEPAARLSTGKEIPNTQNLYRSYDGYCLGQHTPQFTFIQPEEFMHTLEKARQLVGGEWRSAGSFKSGKSISGFFDIEAKITAPSRGDRVGLAVGGFDRFDGNGLNRLQLFANTLACENGMVSPRSLFAFSEKHNGSLAERFAAMEFNLAIRLQMEIEQMDALVSHLDSTPMTRTEAVNFAAQLYPATDENEVSPRIANTREAVVVGFSRGLGNVGRTRWDAFNAVTENLDWNSSFRETEYSREENRFESLTSGNGAKIRARALELLTA